MSAFETTSEKLFHGQSGSSARKAVALILAHPWARVSTPPLMTARYLADSGYLVDMFIEYNESLDALGLCLADVAIPNLQVYAHHPDGQAPLLNLRNGAVLPPADASAVAGIVREHAGSYDWLIGFDPGGLARAAALSEIWGVPYVYHSLEIEEAHSPKKGLEKQCNKGALYTLTQDESRADILARLNSIPRKSIFISVNSSLGEVLPEKSAYFHERFPIGERMIVLATGSLLRETGIEDILASTPYWPRNFVLVLHGWLPFPDFRDAVKDFVAGRDNVFLSEAILPPEEKFQVFQGTDVGLVFFTGTDVNIHYAAGSAGKLYDCMRCGVPIIGNDIPGMRDLVEGNGCGLVVPDAEALPRALPQIARRRDLFRKNCLQVFPRYEFSRCYAPLLRMTEKMVGGRLSQKQV